MELLQLSDISKRFNKNTVFQDISFDIKKGEVLLLTGSNGSGKTTILNLIYGFMRLTQGSIMFNDIPISTLSSYKRSRLGICYMPQHNFIIKSYTLEKNRDIILNSFRKEDIYEEDNELYTNLYIEKTIKQRVSTLSKGELRKAELYFSAVKKSKLYMFDEPINGFDSDSKQLFFNKINELKALGRSIIICDHENNDEYNYDTKIHLHEGTINIENKK